MGDGIHPSSHRPRTRRLTCSKASGSDRARLCAPQLVSRARIDEGRSSGGHSRDDPPLLLRHVRLALSDPGQSGASPL